MKQKLLFALAGLALLIGAMIATYPGRGRAQDRGQAAVAAPQGQPNPAAGSETNFDLNRDVQVTPDQGPWMVCVTSYLGPDAPQMAREMVMWLRETYKLPAYVFNYGAEQRRKEKERVQAELQAQIQRQQEFLQQYPQAEPVPIRARVRSTHIDDQCAVLMGDGYRDMDAARRALDDLRRRDPPDPRRVKMNMAHCSLPGSKPGQEVQEQGCLNPFRESFVVHNPTIPITKAAPGSDIDIGLLRHLNADESFSLLECRKPVTLVLAQYATPGVMDYQKKEPTFWDKIGLGGKSSGAETVDAVAHTAHNVADYLRKANYEAFVLHTKFHSLVTVGSFDGPNDPRLKQTQERFVSLSQTAGYRQLLQQLQLFPIPLPMEVPH